MVSFFNSCGEVEICSRYVFEAVQCALFARSQAKFSLGVYPIDRQREGGSEGERGRDRDVHVYYYLQ